jgi:hypothetical protein
VKKLAIIGVAAIAMGMVAAPAQAKDVDVKGTASCSTGVKAKIKAGPRDVGQMKSNVQIDDAGTVRRAWTITLTDGAQSITRTVRTAGASNSIDQDFFTTNNPGAETITFVATRSGASCSGTVVVP